MAVRQTVVSDTNSPKTLTFNKLRGVDYSSSPFEVSTSRATSMKNMINEDGVNHKRHGWSEDLEINKKISEMNIVNIKGIYISPNKDTKLKYVIATDSKIYSFINSGSYYTLNLTKNDSAYTVKFITNKNKVVIFYPNAIYLFNLDSLKYENSNKYVPTTTISINAISDQESTRKNFEDANLLTAERKNTLIGKKESDFNVIYFVVDYSTSGTEASNITTQFVCVKNSGQDVSEIELPQYISSFPLRTVEDEIALAIKFTYLSMSPSLTSQMCCKVLDKTGSVVYKTYASALSDFFTVKTNEANTFKIVYEMEAI